MTPSATNSRLQVQTPQSAFLLARTQREGFLRHFGFRESPFGVTPDPEFLFWSRMHSAALQAMITSIESNLGFSVLLGRPGTGKTTLLFHLLAQYRESARTAFIFQTQCRAHDLLRHIASELELPVARRDDVSLHQKLNGMLLQEARAGRKVLIVIDEAQNLQAPSLEAIRLLSNFETGPSKLLNVVLSGSLRLGEMLVTPELSQLAQRISTVSRLDSLTAEEVKDYVRFRIAVVASKAAEQPFSSESLAEIATQSEGVPRIINSICYRALILAYTHGQAFVSREVVKEAVTDLNLSEPGGRDSRAAIQFPETEDAPPSPGVFSPIPLARSELRWKPPVQALVETRRVPSVDEKSLAQTAHSPPDVNSRDINWRSQAVPAQADQGSRIRAPATIRFRSAGWRSTGLIAALVLLAFGSWVGWNELRVRLSTSGGYSPPSQPESLGPEVKPSPHEVTNAAKNEVPQSWVQEPVDIAAPPPTNPNIHQTRGIQGRPVIDLSPNLLLLSKIRSQALTSADPLAPSNVVSMPKASRILALLVTAGPTTLPRLEAPKMAATSEPQAAFSPKPIKVIKPEYPVKAKLSHIEGAVEVELTIDRNGNVEKVRGLSGNSILLQEAEEAVRQWKYSPFTGDQITVPVVTRVQFNFKLDTEAKNR